MGRNTFVSFILCIWSIWGATAAYSSDYIVNYQKDSIDIKISKLTGEYLNYNCFESNDSVLLFCASIIRDTVHNIDYDTKLSAEFLYVNALCLNGNINEGIKVAKQMYDEAKKFDHVRAKVLSIQAMGATFMYSGEYNNADTTFLEAEIIMQKNTIDAITQLNLVIQQLHTYMNLNNSTLLSVYLDKAKKLIDDIPVSDQGIYRFYIDCYQTISHIKTGNIDAATHYVGNIMNNMPYEGYFARWRYYLFTNYYNLSGDINKALLYCDSSLIAINRVKNMVYYKNTLVVKADLLEKLGNIDEACKTYERINYLTDSLNFSEYGEQINSLHLTYWVDQLEIDNTSARNRFLTMASIYTSIALLLIILLFIYTRHKNKQLELSRIDLKQAREAAKDSIRLKSLFLSNMSHELRTPLNAIVGFSEILTDNDDIDIETKHLCSDNIKQNSELLMRLINDVVDFSELKGDKIKFSFELSEVVSLCENVIKTVESIKQTRASLHFVSSVDKLELYTDKERIQQVLINLLVNATKFTKEGSITLTLNIDSSTEMAVFAVEDTGCGIPLEKQAHIFERFEKLHENIQGTGLGLSICQLIVEQVNGQIWIDSEYTKGARFVFTHPLHKLIEN